MKKHQQAVFNVAERNYSQEQTMEQYGKTTARKDILKCKL